MGEISFEDAPPGLMRIAISEGVGTLIVLDDGTEPK